MGKEKLSRQSKQQGSDPEVVGSMVGVPRADTFYALERGPGFGVEAHWRHHESVVKKVGSI